MPKTKEKIEDENDDEIDKSFKHLEIDAITKFKDSQTLCMRLFWLILLILFTVIMVYEVYKTIHDYYNSPIKTSYIITTKEDMDFPMVYVCTPNKVRKSYLKHNRTNVKIAENMRFLTTGQLEDYGDVEQLMQQKLIDGNEDGHYLKKLHMEMGPKENELFVFCSYREFLTKQIQCKEVYTPVMDPNYGKCFMLSVGNRTQQVPCQGLTIIYNIKSQDFPSGQEEDENLVPKFLGLMIGVAAEFNPTNLDSVLVPAQHYTRLDMAKTRFEFINVEHGDSYQPCKDTDDFPFEILSGNYSASACKLDCFLKNLAKKCSCLTAIDEIFLKDDILQKYPYCTVKQLHDCLEYNQSALKDETEACQAQCITSCQGWRFKSKASSIPLNLAAFPKMPDNTSTLIDLVYVQIAFTYLEYDSFSQAQSLALDDAISNVGGQVNLWLGMSMFTVIQMPALLILFCTCKLLDMCRLKKSVKSRNR